MLSLTRIPARIFRLALAAMALAALAGCATSPSPLLPASTNAALISNLTTIVFVIAAVVFVIVEGALLYSVIRYSRNQGPGEPEQIEGNTKFEIAWTAAPAIVLLIVFFVSLQALFPLRSAETAATSPGSASNAPLNPRGANVHVRVIGHQWWWEFDYPDYGFTTAGELHVPVDGTVLADLESADVIHSFWVPQLGGKTDVIPGHMNQTWFKPTEVGTFHGQCAEFCGIEHANMRFDVVVQSTEDFATWLKTQEAPTAPVPADAVQGEQTFMTGACIGCHTIEGTKAQGKVGPNLTHFATRSKLAGAILENTPENLARWLADPQAVKPGTVMPNLHLTQDQISALVQYLESRK